MKQLIFSLAILVAPSVASATDVKAVNDCLGRLESEYKEEQFKCRGARDGSNEFCMQSAETKYRNGQTRCQTARNIPGAAGLKEVVGGNALGGKVK